MVEEDQRQVSIRRILCNESLLRSLILFGILFTALILQRWDNLLLPLFPVLLFAEAVFFRAVHVGQELNFSGLPVTVVPLGLGKQIADRVEFAAFLVLVTLLIQGYDSIARPQLIADLSPYFLELLLATYLLGHYWVLSGVPNAIMKGHTEEKKSDFTAQEELMLKISSYSSICYLILFGIGTIFNLLSFYAATPAILVNVPGSTLPNGTPVAVSGALFLVLLAPWVITIVGMRILFTRLPPPRIPRRIIESTFL